VKGPERVTALQVNNAGAMRHSKDCILKDSHDRKAHACSLASSSNPTRVRAA
jgi:hypothetical protein